MLLPGTTLGEWRMFHHDPQHTGRSTRNNQVIIGNESGIVYVFKPSGRLLSQHELFSEIHSSPISHRDTVYIVDTSGLMTVYKNRRFIRDIDLGYSFINDQSPGIGRNNIIYASTYQGHFVAYSHSGETVFDLNVSSQPLHTLTLDDHDNVYFGSDDGYVYSYSSNGVLRWKYSAGSPIWVAPAIGADGTVYFIADGLYALYPDGTLKWKYSISLDYWSVSSPAIWVDGTVYFGLSDGCMYAIRNSVLAWRYCTGDIVRSSPAVGVDGTIYFGSDDSYFYALYQDGSLKWKYSTGDSIVSSPAIGVDGTVYFGSLDYYVYTLYHDGSLKWKYETEDEVHGSPAII